MGQVAVLMDRIELLELITDALAEVYSGATTLEAAALTDKLADRGLLVVFDDEDMRVLDVKWSADDLAGYYTDDDNRDREPERN